jgi:hypothetical protein
MWGNRGVFDLVLDSHVRTLLVSNRGRTTTTSLGTTAVSCSLLCSLVSPPCLASASRSVAKCLTAVEESKLAYLAKLSKLVYQASKTF